MTTILMKSEQFFFRSPLQFRFVSFRMIMLCFAKYETYETGFRMQGVFFREIRNSFCMKFSRILYERNSSVNPSRRSATLLRQFGLRERWKLRGFFNPFLLESLNRNSARKPTSWLGIPYLDISLAGRSACSRTDSPHYPSGASRPCAQSPGSQSSGSPWRCAPKGQPSAASPGS